MDARRWRARRKAGVISPLLSNIYLHVLDRVWEDRCAHLGTLVRYADDFVVMCDTKAAGRGSATAGEHRAHASRARAASGEDEDGSISRAGREGFDFLGCHLRKRMSGPIWERTRQRVYYLHRWPSQRAMTRVRARVRELTPRARCHADLRVVIADLNPVLRGWGNYFRTGNAANHFTDLDQYVERRLRGLLLKRAGSRLTAGRAVAWDRPFFEALGSSACAARFSIRGRRMPRPEDHR